MGCKRSFGSPPGGLPTRRGRFEPSPSDLTLATVTWGQKGRFSGL